MIKLAKWTITKEQHKKENYFLAWGNVTGHQRLVDGTYIHTSKIMKLEYDASTTKLIMTTYSKNEYELLINEMDMERYEETVDNLKEFHVTIPSYDECNTIIQETEKEQMTHIEEILKDGELYLKVKGSYVSRAFWKKDMVREIKVSAHIGMFQDSYLITDWEKGEVDFRYFDALFGIRPYHYSDGLNAILIENCGAQDITFTEGMESIICKTGEVTRIESDFFRTEGLFSPDVVNGKNAIWNDVSDEEAESE